MKKAIYDRMQVLVCDSQQAAGAAAADDLAEILRAAIAERGEAAIIVATGNSQLSFMKAIRARPDIRWGQVTVFHMDEYLHMSDQHPASFRRYIREQLTDRVGPRVFYGIVGDAADPEQEMARYADLLRRHDPVACILGIGENGHLAFNDPPADFDTDRLIHIVDLDETCRRQQVGEGHFANLEQVPAQAISLTVPALLRPAHVLAVVPEARKAQAVRDALLGPVTPDCPASILRTKPQVTLYLDPDSASLLDR
ncbi:MAG TPA: glucosamine-6-phosphate deaminase [Anaerolineae bacterium]|nr:glucosamine-6-phosphate deaminase [Anaerolineae bacterium]HOQ97792.1 glucosamine-6-phosphate deaminase [Anaerolineae bacterium]HPL27105.1 glucosamine-6-phosphate deaminase [Anaerolineae bacterium]